MAGRFVGCQACKAQFQAVAPAAPKPATVPTAKPAGIITLPASAIASPAKPMPTPSPPRSPFDFNAPDSNDRPTAHCDVDLVDTSPGVENDAAALRRDLQQYRRMLAWFLDWRRIPSALGHWLMVPLFFLPWLTVSCNGQTMLTQSGLQACYRGGTLSPRLQRFADEANAAPIAQPLPIQKGVPAKKGDAVPLADRGFANRKSKDLAHFIWPFPVFVLLGIISGLVCVGAVLFQFRSISAGAHLLSLGCGVCCFALLGLQMSFKFPLEKRVEEASRRANEAPPLDLDGRPNPFAQAAGMMINMETTYTPWFWLEFGLAMLFIPLLVLEVGVSCFQVGRALMAEGDP
jgi:hypothetical protein